MKSSFWYRVQTEAKLLSTQFVCCVFMRAGLILCLWGWLNMFEGGSRSHLSKAVTGVVFVFAAENVNTSRGLSLK